MRFGPHPITLRQLRYIVAVAEHGNFRRAATACHVSQPSLSAQVAQMSAGGVGVNLLPSLALPVENRHKVLQVRGFAPTAPSRTLALCWRRGSALTATVEPVAETMRKVYQALVRHAR